MDLRRIGNLNRGGWLAAGIVLAFALAPSAAIATAAGVTEITSPGGQRATVTKAGQLTTAPASAGSFEIR